MSTEQKLEIVNRLLAQHNAFINQALTNYHTQDHQTDCLLAGIPEDITRYTETFMDGLAKLFVAMPNN
jgi:hypothetical protein